MVRRLLQFAIPAACAVWIVQLLVSCGNADAHALGKSAPEPIEEGGVAPIDASKDEPLRDGSFSSEARTFALPEDTDPIAETAQRSTQHPYLLVGDQRMLAEAKDPSSERSKIFAAVKKVVDAAGSSCPRTGLASFGLCYWVTGDTKYAKAVNAELNKQADRAQWSADGERSRIVSAQLVQYALGFDFCYDYLKKQPTFKKVRDKLALETSKVYEAATGKYNATWKNWWRHAYSQNHFHRNARALVYGALALKFEGNALSKFNQNDVDNWIAAAKEEWIKNHEATKGIVDGSWFEGDGYDETTLGSDVPDALFMLKKVEGLDLITTSPWLRMAAVYWLYNSNPDKARFRLMQSGDNGAAWVRKNGFLSMLRLCAREFRDPQAQWGADQLVKFAKRDARFSIAHLYGLSIVHEFFYFDKTVRAQSPDGNWPESWHARDLEATFMRTGWQKGQLHAALKCGAYGGHNLFEISRANYGFSGGKWSNQNFALGGAKGIFPQDIHFSPAHAHPDNNGFYIVGGGVYLAPENAGKLKQNTSGPLRMTQSHNTITIDGRGQIGDGYVHPRDGNDRAEFFKSDGFIPIFAPTANFDLTVGDATRCYPRALGLKEFRRHFFFLKPDYFVVFDSLDANAPRDYTWNCHFTDPVSFEGRWVKGMAEQGNVLGVNVVSPNSFSRETGATEAATFLRYLASDSQLNFVRLTTKGAAKRRFITVLFPTTTDRWNRRPDVTKIMEDDTAAGVRVSHKSGAEDVILSGYNATGLTTIGSYRLDGVGAVVRRNPNGGLLSVYIAKGKELREGGRLLAKFASTGGSFEASFDGDRVDVTGTDIRSFELHAPAARTVTVNGESVDFTRSEGQITVEP